MDPISYEIRRSDRRTLAIQVLPGGKILIRAPRHASRREIEAMVREHEDWIKKQVFKREEEEAPEDFTEAEREALIRKAKEILPKRVEYFSRLMGVAPMGITVTGAKTRYGSCSGKNRLSFSSRLMQYPAEAVDAVVVHELAHIRHKDHSAAFYEEVERVLPDYRERKKLLRGLMKQRNLTVSERQVVSNHD